ncbi:MAG: hypothetical protein PUP93_26560 [Rhizonema sp. NSF051]|nr:hypothetical protein [Rhizonema sp. NSF051]
MKVKWLLVFAMAPISVGAIVGFLDTKSVIMGAIVLETKLCPEYETNSKLEALSNCVESADDTNLQAIFKP